jgi:hypothetical protein
MDTKYLGLPRVLPPPAGLGADALQSGEQPAQLLDSIRHAGTVIDFIISNVE